MLLIRSKPDLPGLLGCLMSVGLPVGWQYYVKTMRRITKKLGGRVWQSAEIPDEGELPEMCSSSVLLL